MNILSQVNEENFDIEIAIDPNRENCFCATIDGREVELKIIEAKPSSLTLSIDGCVRFYEFYKEKGRINTVAHDNRFFKVRLRNRQQDQLEQLLEEFGAGMGGTATDTRIMAPMPGKILGLNVKAGDKVQLGQVVLVLEAMKMENEISSTVEGKVTKINVKVGDIVNNGDIMIETEQL
ncbi:biotin/lipoyl-binding protein [bacterium]|nr:biotin/lipoyl-binding protein [bacterium]